MLQMPYMDAVEDTPALAREREVQAFTRAIELMDDATAAGPKSREAIEAIYFQQRLWGVLIDDLRDEGNSLPENLRAEIISIGLWVLGELEAIRRGERESFADLREVTVSIRKGLE